LGGIGVSPPELISEVEYPHLNHYDAKIKIVPILINLNPLLSKIRTRKEKVKAAKRGETRS
jgi:hypothetical protein